MKKLLSIAALLVICSSSKAQIPGVSLVTGIVKKVIVALDIKVQQLQNQTLALQNAARSVENTLSLNQLNEINDWVAKEKTLYQTYYDELAKVRPVIAGYRTVKRIIGQQSRLVAEYKNTWALLRRDKHFKVSELKNMGGAYEAILAESAGNLDELLRVTTALGTQMSDGERLETVLRISAAVQTNLDRLRQFNRENGMLSLLRAKDAADKNEMRKLYGL